MSTVNEYALQSELAQAAYGTFSIGLIDIEDLTGDDVEMPTSQAARFAEKWQVSAQYTDPVTGVSATVFEEVGSGAKHLAVRGTQPVNANDIVELR
jgi:hypothetical protein